MTVLSPEQAEVRLAEVPGWELSEGRLHRELQFRDFTEAFGFMTRVALAAEKLNHHPDWSNSWNTVVVDISSHSAGGITDQCFQLAAAINRAAGE
jgi:4a-hydroxytetrahydrobiopterin dehydratase